MQALVAARPRHAPRRPSLTVTTEVDIERGVSEDRSDVNRVSLSALCVLAGVALTLPATASVTDAERSLTIRLVSTPGKTALRDVPPKGLAQGQLSKGDRISGTSILRNAAAQFGKAKGARVGGDAFTMTITTPPKATISVKVTLPDGTMRAKGQGNATASRLKIAIVGGSGAYAGAKGTAESRNLSGGRSLNVYRVRLP